MMKKFIMIYAFIALLPGCSNTQYSCSGSPQRGQCQSLSDVYAKTDDELQDYRHQRTSSKNDSLPPLDEMRSIQLQQENGVTPLLTKPQVLRIFFQPFEDSDRDLNLGGYVYIKVSDSQWQIKN